LPKLVLALHVSLAGVIQSMAPVTLPGRSREGLALTFKDAKLSVVAFDPQRNDLETLSLPQFEEAEYQVRHRPLLASQNDSGLNGGRSSLSRTHALALVQTLHENLCRPLVQVDPAGRCMAMPIYGTHLAVLPLQQESASGLGLDLDTDAAAPYGGARSASVYPCEVKRHAFADVLPRAPVHWERSSRSPVRLPYVIDLRAIDARIRHIRDVVFLDGYFEPTILIAHEPLPTFPGYGRRGRANRKPACTYPDVTGLPLAWLCAQTLHGLEGHVRRRGHFAQRCIANAHRGLGRRPAPERLGPDGPRAGALWYVSCWTEGAPFCLSRVLMAV